MGTAVRKLEIRIDQTGNAKEGMGKLSGGLGALAGPAGIAAAAIAAVGTATIVAGAKLISMGSDAEEMQGKFNVVFGSGAEGMQMDLRLFGDAIGRSTFELMEMASTVQDTFVPMGFARREAQQMSLNLTKLAVDMGSFNNVADDEVMLALQSAIVGNHETMRKYGVVITQATLEQELLRAGLAGSIKEATEQEKVQARLNFIYAGTSDAQGDAERTAGSWANQMRALKSTISETATSIGLELLPFVTPLLTAITDLAKTALPPLLEGFKEIMSHLKAELQPVLKELFAAFGEIFEALGLGAGEVDWLKLAIDGLKITITLIARVMMGFATTLGHVAAAVKAVGDAIKWVTGKWDDMKRAARDAIAAIPKWLQPGSPTPFEIGLRGIGDALSDIDLGQMGASMVGTPAMAAAGAGGITVNLIYSPVVSLADRYEAEEKLAPYIANGLRKLGVVA